MSVANLQTMKNILLPSRSLLIAIVFFSLFAFLAVNVHARFTGGAAATTQTDVHPAKVEATEQASPQNLPLPSLTVVERVLEIAGHFLPISN